MRRDRNYTFYIWSQNINGTSKDNSIVHIPSDIYNITEPRFFNKVDFGNGKYELLWEKPSHIEITNYTIFWCKHITDRPYRPYQCTGFLNWTIVPNNLTAYNMTVEEKPITQFAIAANTKYGSSGMTWASCTVLYNDHIGKLKNVWINKIGSDFIELQWKIDCLDKIGSVYGFVTYYCPIKSQFKRECKDGRQSNVTIKGDSSTVNMKLTNLKPYTTYRLAVAVISKHGMYSEQSDPLFNTTLEGAPSRIEDLEILNTSNTTITLAWSVPEYTNGKLRYYEIHYNNKIEKVDHQENNKDRVEVRF